MKNIFKILTVLILFLTSCSKDIVENIVSTPEICTKKYVPNQRIAEYSTLQTIPYKATSPVTIYAEYDYWTYLAFNKDSTKTWDYIKKAEQLEIDAYAKGLMTIRFITKLWTDTSPYFGNINDQLDQFSVKIDSLNNINKLPKADVFSLREHQTTDGGIAYEIGRAHV